MKTSTKAIISLIVLIPTIVLVSSFTQPASELQYATLRTTEAIGMSTIIIVYEGKTEEYELSKGSSSNQKSNTQAINKAINLLTSKGYELVSQSGGDYISTYSFVRK